MCHRRLLESAILEMLHPTSRARWHNEYELEQFFFSQGYDPDLVRDVIDDLIERGELDFEIDHRSGDCFLLPEPSKAEYLSQPLSRS